MLGFQCHSNLVAVIIFLLLNFDLVLCSVFMGSYLRNKSAGEIRMLEGRQQQEFQME